jgi:hypothetical protein
MRHSSKLAANVAYIGLEGAGIQQFERWGP